MNVVLDTSTLVSYVLTAGEITRQIMAAWREEHFTLVMSPATMDELRRVLARPSIEKLAKMPVDFLVEGLARFGMIVPGSVVVEGVCRDPKDEIFLACAVEGDAAYLVTSDKDLLVLERYQGTCIVNPGQFLVVLQLRQLSIGALRDQFSREALATIQAELCLEPETAARIAQVLGETG